MTVPVLLCTLIALISGLHAGRSFFTAHVRGGNLMIPALAHMAVSAALMVLSVLLDTTASNMMWMVVATASMAGLGLGALMPVRHAPVAAAPVQVEPELAAPLPAAHAA
ncbi:MULTISPECIES: hypothetical protein [Deinococcus]|uniref:Uncharacterized protein n=1 Tax=Deinococcus rufus TaxID=2136097 RepID=A0ABV7Z6H5_9DEIO|nr:hypothetical protein [Deinococcus sp. AB2017081]WQE95405.1 hypothetical protein U2P90_00590 [Deinococcus sp. AB2017081]